MRKSKVSRKKTRKSGPWLHVFVLAMVFAVTTGMSYLYFRNIFVVESSFIADMRSKDNGTDPGKLKGTSRRLYEARQGTPDIRDSIVMRKDELLVVAENIIRTYLQPYKVRLLDLYMDKKGTIYIDIGDELKRNFKGDAYEELTLIGGLYKKIKATIKDFTSLMILIEGREAESFGGHIDISKPIGEEIAENIQ